MEVQALLQIFSRGIEKEQDQEHAKHLALRLGEVLEAATEQQQKDLVNAINKVLTNLSKSDKKYAQLVISELRDIYSNIDEKYGFKIIDQ